MTMDAFERFTRELARLNGLDEETAGEYAAQCADVPELDGDTRYAIIRDLSTVPGAIIARVLLPEGD